LKPVSEPEWPALIAKHEAAGTCPSCGAPGAFATIISPEGEVQVGCFECGLTEAATAALLRAAEFRRRRRLN
jgi:hypothetical protein